MSHRPERTEKNCLNCGTEVFGKYCHACGQENVEPKETVWHLITHFAYDISHFDGRFFRTVKDLLLKPGFISLEYLKGKRTCYLNPVSMYVFTSAFFFLFFFSVVQPEKRIDNYGPLTYAGTKKDIEENIKYLEARAKVAKSLSSKEDIEDELALNQKDLQRLSIDTSNLNKLNFYHGASFSVSGNARYKTRQQYDSAQLALPASKRDGWIKRQLSLKQIEINNKYGDDPKQASSNLMNIFFHSFPKMLFLSLPLFALLLKLVYIRRKRFFYIDHAIYSIHLYCAMFVMLFLFVCFSLVKGVPYIGWLYYLTIPVVIYMLWYAYKSLRKFYQQRRAKTILKFSILLLLSSFMMLVLFIGFFFFSVFAI